MPRRRALACGVNGPVPLGRTRVATRKCRFRETAVRCHDRRRVATCNLQMRRACRRPSDLPYSTARYREAASRSRSRRGPPHPPIGERPPPDECMGTRAAEGRRWKSCSYASPNWFPIGAPSCPRAYGGMKASGSPPKRNEPAPRRRRSAPRRVCRRSARAFVYCLGESWCGHQVPPRARISSLDSFSVRPHGDRLAHGFRTKVGPSSNTACGPQNSASPVDELRAASRRKERQILGPDVRPRRRPGRLARCVHIPPGDKRPIARDLSGPPIVSIAPGRKTKGSSRGARFSSEMQQPLARSSSPALQ